MKTISITWNENMIQEFSADLPLAEVEQFMKTNNIKQLKEAARILAIKNGQFDKGSTLDCEPEPYITEFDVYDDEEEV